MSPKNTSIMSRSRNPTWAPPLSPLLKTNRHVSKAPCHQHIRLPNAIHDLLTRSVFDKRATKSAQWNIDVMTAKSYFILPTLVQGLCVTTRHCASSRIINSELVVLGTARTRSMPSSLFRTGVRSRAGGSHVL